MEECLEMILWSAVVGVEGLLYISPFPNVVLAVIMFVANILIGFDRLNIRCKSGDITLAWKSQ